MVTLSVETNDFEVAESLYGALTDFGPEIAAEGGDYRVTIRLADDDTRLVNALESLEHHFAQLDGSPAGLDVACRRYVLHAAPDS